MEGRGPESLMPSAIENPLHFHSNDHEEEEKKEVFS